MIGCKLSGSVASMMGIGAVEKATEIASSGDRSGVTTKDVGDVATSAGISGAVGKAIDYIATL